MRIISKFKDYYDGVVSATGVDEKRMFERFSREESINLRIHNEYLKIHNVWNEYNADSKNPVFEPFILGFCGILYVGWEIIWYEKPDIHSILTSSEKHVRITYDRLTIEEIIKNNHEGHNLKYRLQKLNNFFEAVKKIDAFKLFTDYHTAYFKLFLDKSYNGTFAKTIEIYPNLKELNFPSEIDPFTAMQEIQMFLFGVLGNNENKMIETVEKYRIAAHGYDQMSFRQRAPGQKKEQRKQNKLRKKLKKQNKS